jgi:error-prone DNA polymerase
VIVAGCAIVRQRPGTASGLLFMSLEDETGISNVVVMPDLFERYRLLINRERFLLIDGKMQNMDGVLTVRAERVRPLNVTAVETASHDYH